MGKEAWFDVSVIRCPKCGRFYVDASWYVVEIGSDIECGTCHKTFNTNKNMIDRVMLRLELDDEGKARDVEITKHLE